jgi:mono/diheme cytochrome c family protein
MKRTTLLFGLMVATQVSAQAPASVERGRYLMEGVLSCGNCHFQRGQQGQPLPERGLSGGMVFDQSPAFKAYASNITPDPDTGIGRWTDAQLARAIREGVRPDGSIIGPPMPPMEFYRHLSDDDLQAVIAYLRAQPPVKNVVPKSIYRGSPLSSNKPPPLGKVTAPPVTDKVAYGKYLADIAHCMECHTPRDEQGGLMDTSWGAGGQVFKGPWGASVAGNLTPHPTGLQGWTDEQIARAIRSGIDRNGQPYKPPMAFSFYATITDPDMAALVAYLRSLPAVTAGGAVK